MTSLEISELLSKKHSHVIRDIENILAELCPSHDPVSTENDEDDTPKLDVIEGCALSSYIDRKGERRKMYVLSRKFTMLVMYGYSVTLRLKAMNYLEQVEEKLYGLRLTNEQKQLQIKSIYNRQVDLFEAASQIRLDGYQTLSAKMSDLRSRARKPKAYWDKYFKVRADLLDKEYKAEVEYIQQTVRDAIVSVGLFYDDAMYRLADIEHSYLGRPAPTEKPTCPLLCNDVQNLQRLSS